MQHYVIQYVSVLLQVGEVFPGNIRNSNAYPDIAISKEHGTVVVVIAW
jgi:hypothetical protein